MRLALVVLVFISAIALTGLLYQTNQEVAKLENTLTACRNTPAKLARELTKEEMAAEIARTKKDRAWRVYLVSKVPCPKGRECR